LAGDLPWTDPFGSQNESHRVNGKNAQTEQILDRRDRLDGLNNLHPIDSAGAMSGTLPYHFSTEHCPGGPDE
jgi:hypothetical protein